MALPGAGTCSHPPKFARTLDLPSPVFPLGCTFLVNNKRIRLLQDDYVCIYIYIYIHIMCIYIQCVCIHINIYIYIWYPPKKKVHHFHSIILYWAIREGYHIYIYTHIYICAQLNVYSAFMFVCMKV